MSWNLEQAANDLERYVLRKEPPAIEACKVLIEYARAERTCKNKRNDLNKNKEPDAPNNWYAFLCSECGMGQRLQYQNEYCPNCGAKVVE